MSHLVEVNKVENLEFRWGKKRGVGGKKKEVQFYESFTYDGVEYVLYDCVYLYKEGEPEPYIGKLIKLWENPDKTKKIKVLWFFRPSEILNWLEDEETLDNELFLASGEGVGLANVNPLEAIAGKCNVVCISKDSRNRQPSEEELRKADYIFNRLFDVGHCTILDKIDEKVAGVEVKFIFNGEVFQKPTVVPKLDPNRKEDSGNAAANNETLLLSKQDESKEYNTVKKNGKSSHSVPKEDADVKASLVEQKSLPEEKPASGAGVESGQLATASVKQENVLGDKATPGSKVDSDKDEGKVGKIVVNHVEEKVQSSIDSGALDNRPFKKAKVDSSVKLSEDNNRNSLQKLSVDSDRKDVKDLVSTYSEDKTKSKFAKDSNEKITKLSNGTLLKASAGQSPDDDIKTDGQIMEVTRRPLSDKSKWFRELPWEERMQTAHEQGTLVLLENLDPAYASAEVEDIVWHALKENCNAKMVQKTAISSPYSGKAFAIFKTREAAEMAVRKLDEGCLMLPNGRPLVGGIGIPPSLPGKQSTFVGHLFIDKIKLQMQHGEVKQAVSTSHCSQPNTIEYEMAMEWCLLQARSDSWWKKLYQQQWEELRKIKANFKSK